MFDLVFNNGEFSASNSSFWADLTVSVIGGAVGSFIGVVGALYVYYKQSQDSDRAKAKLEYDLHVTNINYVRMSLQNLISFNENTVPQLEDFLQRKRKELMQNNQVVTMSMDAIQDLERIDKEKYYLPFITVFKSTNPIGDYNNLMRIFNNHALIYRETIDDINSEVRRVNQIKVEYKDRYNKLIILIAKLNIEIKRFHNKLSSDHSGDLLFRLNKYFLDSFYDTQQIRSDLNLAQQLVTELIGEYVEFGFDAEIDDVLSDAFFPVLFSLKELGVMHSEAKFHTMNLVNHAEEYLRMISPADYAARKFIKMFMVNVFAYQTPSFLQFFGLKNKHKSSLAELSS